MRSTSRAAEWKHRCVPETAFKHEHRVTYSECTVGNHVYYSRYLDILEAARGEFFRAVSQPLRQWQENGTAFPVLGVRIDYKGPARYDDVVTTELWVTEMKGIRLTIGFRMLRADGSPLAEGETRHICATVHEKPQRLPQELLKAFEPFVRLPAEGA